MFISVTIADICSASGVGSMHFLGVALSRNMVALTVKAHFLEVTQQYLVMTILLAMLDLRPTMMILPAITGHRPMMSLTPRKTPIVPTIHIRPAVPHRPLAMTVAALFW